MSWGPPGSPRPAGPNMRSNARISVQTRVDQSTGLELSKICGEFRLTFIARQAVERRTATFSDVARFFGRDPFAITQLLARHTAKNSKLT